MLFPKTGKYIYEIVLENSLANAKFSFRGWVSDKMSAKGKKVINLDYKAIFHGNMI